MNVVSTLFDCQDAIWSLWEDLKMRQINDAIHKSLKALLNLSVSLGPVVWDEGSFQVRAIVKFCRAEVLSYDFTGPVHLSMLLHGSFELNQPLYVLLVIFSAIVTKSDP